MIDRQRVGRSFHRGAAEYDQHTPVQQRVIQRLQEQLQSLLAQPPARVLDIGCGTGRLLELVAAHWPEAELTGLDLAPNMLCQAAERLGTRATLVQGDAEALPFADNRFDLVISSSTFQWLAQCDTCFGEVRRVLLPGGRFLFALFGSGTLAELQEAWREALRRCGRAKAPERDGTHRFHDAATIRTALERQGFQAVQVASVRETVWYDDLPRLLQAIKRVGAGSARPPQGGGLGWRAVLHSMAEIYTERFATADGVPATYQVIYGMGTVT